jgi:peptide/nickel transport system ATP-binding protein
VSFLSVRDLVVHFPTVDGVVKATEGLSYELERGKTLGIVGESGSGKSVSSMAVLGLHDERSGKLSGSIRIRGREVVGLQEKDMR